MLLKIYLWGVGLQGCKTKSSVHTEKRLQPSFQCQTSNQNPTSQKRICKSSQEQVSAGGFAFPFGKRDIETVKVQSSLAFYNRLFLVPKPNNKLSLILDLSSYTSF